MALFEFTLDAMHAIRLLSATAGTDYAGHAPRVVWSLEREIEFPPCDVDYVNITHVLIDGVIHMLDKPVHLWRGMTARFPAGAIRCH